MVTDAQPAGEGNTAVPLFRPSLPPLEEYVEHLRRIWDSGMLSNFAAQAQELELLASSYLGTPTLAVVSGDVGLIIALKALGLDPESPCFLSDFTFNSTINAAVWNGLRPVLVDCDRRTLNMDPERLADALSRDRSPGVVLATHVFGNPCDTDALGRLAADHGSYVVYDAAHAYGSQREGTPVGSLGDASVFSLSPTKLVTSGEGGLISTPHAWLAERVVYLRAYGFQHDYESHYAGINGKMSELHAALGLICLPTVEEAVLRRAWILEQYRSHLGEQVSWQHVRAADRSTYKDISIGLGHRRPHIEKALGAAGIQTKRYFMPLHHMRAYARFAPPALETSDAAYNSTLCLPCYADLDGQTISRVSAVIEQALRS
jgi:dTDP-4-amino-4,6-dideoxygalactose transaminase